MTLKPQSPSHLYVPSTETLCLVSAVLEMKPPKLMYVRQAIGLLCCNLSPSSCFSLSKYICHPLGLQVPVFLSLLTYLVIMLFSCTNSWGSEIYKKKCFSYQTVCKSLQNPILPDTSLCCAVWWPFFFSLPLLPVFWLHPKLKAALCVVELPSDQLQHIPTLQASAPWTLQENLPENREIDKRQTLGDKEK